MKFRAIRHLITSLAVFAFSISLASAAPYQKGSAVEPFSAKDKYEKPYNFDPAATRYLLVSHDMETGKKANAALSALGKDYLASKKAVYMANIFGMPGIGRFFAIPKMRKYNHPIVLADDAALIARFPEEKGKVAVLTLSGGKVTTISYWTPGTETLETYIK
jgi:hypothetical protein